MRRCARFRSAIAGGDLHWHLWGASVLVSLLIGCTPVAEPPQPQSLPEQFSARILEAGVESEDPWSRAHLLLAFDGRSEVKEMQRAWVDWVSDPLTTIPLKGNDGHRGEQHPHLVLRTAAWLLDDDRHPMLRSRIEQALATTATPSNWKQINDLAWLLESAAVIGVPANHPSADSDVATLALRLLEALEESDTRVLQCLEEGSDRPDGSSGPAGSGTWAYTCGGFHIVSALVEAVEAGYLEPQRQRVVERLLLLCRRISWELQFRLAEEERALATGISPRRAARHSVLARMKLAGHGLDVLARARMVRLLDAEQAQLAAADCLEAATSVVQRFVEEVDPQRVILTAATERLDPHTWERTFGDGCHLLRGLELWSALPRK